MASVNAVDPDFFETMRISILRGRTFHSGERNAAIVSESLARRAWPGEDPIGKPIRDRFIVGIAASARTIELRDGDAVELYYPLAGADPSVRGGVLLIRTGGPPGAHLPAIRAALQSPGDPPLRFDLLSTLFESATEGTRKGATVIGLTGVLALALAALGTGALLSFAVARRTREIGIRVALGATQAAFSPGWWPKHGLPPGGALPGELPGDPEQGELKTGRSGRHASRHCPPGAGAILASGRAGPCRRNCRGLCRFPAAEGSDLRPEPARCAHLRGRCRVARRGLGAGGPARGAPCATHRSGSRVAAGIGLTRHAESWSSILMKPRSAWLWPLALFLLNLFLVRRLLGIEYLDEMGSIEASFIAIARWAREHWNDLSWFPLWYGGIPYVNTYPPLLHRTVAAASALGGLSVPHAYHAVTAVFYSLGPVALHALAVRLGASRAIGFAGGLFYTLVSTSTWLIPTVQRDAGGVWGLRRLQAMLQYGEGPHITSLTLLPLALWLLATAFERRRPVWWFATVLGLAAGPVPIGWGRRRWPWRCLRGCFPGRVFSSGSRG